jgi:hypothetical protein
VVHVAPESQIRPVDRGDRLQRGAGVVHRLRSQGRRLGKYPRPAGEAVDRKAGRQAGAEIARQRPEVGRRNDTAVTRSARGECACHQLPPHPRRLSPGEHEELGELERPVARDAAGVAERRAAVLRQPRVGGGAREMIEEWAPFGPELRRIRRSAAAERLHAEPLAELGHRGHEDAEEGRRVVGARGTKGNRHAFHQMSVGE